MKFPRLLGKTQTDRGKGIDYTFLTVVIMLLAYGLIMVFSASSASAHYRMGDTFYFIKRQGICAVIGLIGMYVFSVIHYKKYYKWALPFLGIVVILLVLVLTPLGVEVNGASRWLGFSFLTFQPSELAKFALIIFLAKYLTDNGKMLEKPGGFIANLVIIGLIAGLVLLEPHMSGAMVIAGVGVVILYVAGAKKLHLSILAVLGIVGAFGLIAIAPYRMARFTTFLDPFADMQGEGFQIVQSLYAIGSGGFFGLGLGQSRQKFLYLPEPQNDFIFSIICEELGFFGALLVIVLFAVLIWKGIQIAMRAPDKFSSLLVAGIISLVAIQVILNIAVVTSSMPATGVPLPFFSYGGTSLIIMLCGMGIVLNVTRHIKK
ncbi:MAG: putative lipid II flippase FtsW [Clostridia bacterium]|nr:putative lipid II flippase FtsW [Clostridia bacterium]